jgi:hypothetical protein
MKRQALALLSLEARSRFSETLLRLSCGTLSVLLGLCVQCTHVDTALCTLRHVNGKPDGNGHECSSNHVVLVTASRRCASKNRRRMLRSTDEGGACFSAGSI